MKDQTLNHYSNLFNNALKPNKVYINGELIYTTDNDMGESFYSYTYPSDGQYAIKMEWNSAISSTSNMFDSCSALVSLESHAASNVAVALYKSLATAQI